MSNWVNHAHVNSKIQLNVGSFTLNVSRNFEVSNQTSNFQREIQSYFLIPLGPIFQNKAH